MIMTAELQVVGHSFRNFTPLETVLGGAEGRYFGAGYRNVGYSLDRAQSQDGTLTAVGQVHYPPAWSTDAGGGVRQPHLSSVDAALLPLALLEKQMAPREFAGAGRLRVTSLHLVAGSTPFLALDAVPIRLTVEATADGQHIRAVVGNIKVTMALAVGTDLVDVRDDAAPEERTSVYSSLFRQVESTSSVRHVEDDAARLLGDHALSAPPSAQPRGGFEALQWPAPTLIDYLVLMGQLTQALVYTAAGRQRATSGPLWMRSIDIDLRGAPSVLPLRFQTGIQLLRDRTLRRGGVTLHDCKVEASTSTDVSALATLAYQEL